MCRHPGTAASHQTSLQQPPASAPPLQDEPPGNRPVTLTERALSQRSPLRTSPQATVRQRAKQRHPAAPTTTAPRQIPLPKILPLSPIAHEKCRLLLPIAHEFSFNYQEKLNNSLTASIAPSPTTPPPHEPPGNRPSSSEAMLHYSGRAPCSGHPCRARAQPTFAPADEPPGNRPPASEATLLYSALALLRCPSTRRRPHKTAHYPQFIAHQDIALVRLLARFFHFRGLGKSNFLVVGVGQGTNI